MWCFGNPQGTSCKVKVNWSRGTTMNVYGSASLKAKRQANSKVVQMAIPHGQLAPISNPTER